VLRPLIAAGCVRRLVASDRKPRDAPLKTVGIASGLADDVDHFIEQHPEFGIKFRNEFANQAVQHFLHVLRNRVYMRLVVDAAAQGKHGHLDALLKASKDPDESGE
jgi:hypothetical protein